LLNLIEALIARLQREEGQTVVEYAMVLGGVSVVLITALVATGLDGIFATLLDQIQTAMGQ
jgi:Flp pilus assembly pilin Flp